MLQLIIVELEYMYSSATRKSSVNIAWFSGLDYFMPFILELIKLKIRYMYLVKILFGTCVMRNKAINDCMNFKGEKISGSWYFIMININQYSNSIHDGINTFSWCCHGLAWFHGLCLCMYLRISNLTIRTTLAHSKELSNNLIYLIELLTIICRNM